LLWYYLYHVFWEFWENSWTFCLLFEVAGKKFEVIFRSIFRPLFLYLLEIYMTSDIYDVYFHCSANYQPYIYKSSNWFLNTKIISAYCWENLTIINRHWTYHFFLYYIISYHLPKNDIISFISYREKNDMIEYHISFSYHFKKNWS
jgi:hypothetical protein